MQMLRKGEIPGLTCAGFSSMHSLVGLWAVCGRSHPPLSSINSASLKTDESHQVANYWFRPCWERGRSFNRTGAALVPDREILAGGDVRFSAVAVARYCPGASTASKWKWPARSAFVVQRSLGSSAL